MSLRQTPAWGAPGLRRGVLAVASLALATASLSACAAGNDAASLDVKPDNPETSAGGVQIQNGVVIVGESGDEPVVVSASLTNNTSKAQKLESVTVEGAGGGFTLAGADGQGDITVPAGGTVLLGGEGNPSATLDGSADAVAKAVGTYRTVTFTFSDSGKVPLEANVVPDTGYYADFAGTPAPAVSPSESAPAPGSSAEAPGQDENSQDEDDKDDKGKGDDENADGANAGEESGDAGNGGESGQPDAPASPNASGSPNA